MDTLDNANPTVHRVGARVPVAADAPLPQRVFEAIRDIRDPEHPNTLEELAVVGLDSITTHSRAPTRRAAASAEASVGRDDDNDGGDGDDGGPLQVTFTPTVPHCSMAALIGLCIRKRLADKGLLLQPPPRPPRKLRVLVEEETHVNWREITKQLNDKERVLAAMENDNLRAMVDECLVAPSRYDDGDDGEDDGDGDEAAEVMADDTATRTA